MGDYVNIRYNTAMYYCGSEQADAIGKQYFPEGYTKTYEEDGWVLVRSVNHGTHEVIPNG